MRERDEGAVVVDAMLSNSVACIKPLRAEFKRFFEI
jgi:hypothetical protein